MREPTVTVASTTWRHRGATDGKRIIPEETAVAFTYDGGSYAVMMATPQNLEDFALGFSFTERVISSPADIRQLDIVEHDAGIELRMWLSEPHAAALSDRRRHLAGPTGCGLCGIESLDEAVRPVSRVTTEQTFTVQRDHGRAGIASGETGAEPTDSRGSCCGILALGRRAPRGA